MGRFEKRPENPRIRGELSRAAETALWAVVEDLENIQQNVLRTLNDEIKRLQAEKKRLNDEIQQLITEKEHLQQVRQITEQQVLIRQLSEALAKHISSQLQSSLASIYGQVEGEKGTLKSAATNQSESQENVEKLLGSLDDTLTITFNSLQQELKNYQNNLSQQLSRMYSQQQEGETILEEIINHLRRELSKAEAIRTSQPTVLQLPQEQQPNSPLKTYLQLGNVTSNIEEPISELTAESSPSNITPAPTPASSVILISPSAPDKAAEATTLPPSNLVESENTHTPIAENIREEIFAIASDLSLRNTTNTTAPEQPPEKSSALPPQFSETENTTNTPAPEKPPEPISVLRTDLSETENTTNNTAPEKSPEPISVLRTDLSETKNTTNNPAPEKPPEPISVLRTDLSETENTTNPQKNNSNKPISLLRRNQPKKNSTNPSPASAPKPEGTTAPRRSSQGLTPIQIGFLLIVLSTVVSSIYNVAIKIMFHTGSEILGVVQVESLLAPTLGNIMLILWLRLVVVVPLILLLAPMMYPQVWQDLQNLWGSIRGNPTPSNLNIKKTLQLSIASGCFLFLSQVLIYMAIGQVATGMAITLFFVYPMISGFLSWLLFRESPSGFRAAAIGAIFCGELLVLAGATSMGMGDISLGSSAALGAGLAFACYVLLTRICAAKLHPVTFTLINFATMFLLSFICLMLPLPNSWSLTLDPTKVLEIILTGFILGVLTLFGYVFNHVGIGKLGASRAAIIGAGIPILTVIFAGLIIQESLEILQILGVLLVTFGAAAFSFEKMQNPAKSPSPGN